MSASQEKPAPLVPPHVDLRGYEYMPFYGDRCFKSVSWLEASKDARLAMLMLWWHAFSKEFPAASLPNNDKLLCEYAGFGAAPRTWRKLKAEVMRGFIECSDGRLYHKFTSKIAIEAWEFREAQRNRTEAARRAKADKKARDCAESQGLSQTASQNLSQSSSQSPKGPVTDSKGKERIGKDRTENQNQVAHASTESTGYGPPTESARAPAAPTDKTETKAPNLPAATMAGLLSKTLREEGVTGCTPHHPTIVEWTQRGVTVQLLREAVDLARDKKPKPQPIPIAYLKPIIEDLVKPPQARPPVPNGKDWWETGPGVLEKAKQVGVEPVAQNPDIGEGIDYYATKLHIILKIGDGPWIDKRNVTEMRMLDRYFAAQRTAAA